MGNYSNESFCFLKSDEFEVWINVYHYIEGVLVWVEYVNVRSTFFRGYFRVTKVMMWLLKMTTEIVLSMEPCVMLLFRFLLVIVSVNFA